MGTEWAEEPGVWVYSKVVLTAFAAGVDVECERKGRTKDDSKHFGLSHWPDAAAIHTGRSWPC